MNIKFLAVSIVCSQVLVACGGGGGSSAPGQPGPVAAQAQPGSVGAPPPGSAQPSSGPSVAIDAAFSNLYAAAHNFDRTETDPNNGNVYNPVADFAVGAATTIEGVSVKSAKVNRSLTKNGVLVQKSSEISYFQTGPYKLIATQSQDSSLYQAVSGQNPLPASGMAGDSGAFYNATVYDSADKKTVLSTSIYKWEISADSATTLTLCVNSTTIFPSLSGTVTNSECYKIDTNGAVTGVGFNVPK